MNRLKSFAAFLACWIGFGLFSAWFMNILTVDPKHAFRDNGLIMYGILTGFIFGGMMWGLIYPPRRLEPLPKPLEKLSIVSFPLWTIFAMVSLSLMIPIKRTDDLWPLLFIGAFSGAGATLLCGTRKQRVQLMEEATERLTLAKELDETIKQFVMSVQGRANKKGFDALLQLSLLDTPVACLERLIKNQGYWSRDLRLEAQGSLSAYCRVRDVVNHPGDGYPLEEAIVQGASALHYLLVSEPSKERFEEVRYLINKIKGRNELAFA